MDEKQMEIGWIGAGTLEPFRHLLLPQAVQALERGEPITALGVTQDQQAWGAIAAWLRQDGTLEIQSLYVAPDCRRRGAGRLLVDTLCSLAQGRCQIVTASYTHTRPEHDTLPPFFRALGFAPEEEQGNVYQITLGELAQSPFFAAGQGAAPDLLPFSQVPRGCLSAAYKKALLQDENYLEGHLSDPEVDQQVSVAILEGGAVRSFAAVTAGEGGRLTLAWVRSGRAQDTPLLLRAAFARMQAQYPPETPLTIQAAIPAAAALVNALAPAARPISYTYSRPVAQA